MKKDVSLWLNQLCQSWNASFRVALLWRREARIGGVRARARSVVSLNRRKVPRWFPSSAPSQGVQQEFIVTALNTLQRKLARCT